MAYRGLVIVEDGRVQVGLAQGEHFVRFGSRVLGRDVVKGGHLGGLHFTACAAERHCALARRLNSGLG